MVQGEVSSARVGTAALAISLTGAVILAARVWHPPAGITAAVVGLVEQPQPRNLLALATGTVFLTAAGWLINRVLGVPVPLWS